MRLVILAAGHGRRFGGLKQLNPVGPRGEALMDYTARSALRGGYDGVVIVVREEIKAAVIAHIRARWPKGLPVEVACQPPSPGTAYATLCARPYVDGPFAVANADDLYGDGPLKMLVNHFSSATSSRMSQPRDERPHAVIAYQLSRTLLTTAEVNRGLCRIASDRSLLDITEHRVRLRPDGRYEAVATSMGHDWPDGPARTLRGDEAVSMNLWGFDTRIFDHLEAATRNHASSVAGNSELLLPTVVGSLLDRRLDRVKAINTSASCIGVTHREDVPVVLRHLRLASESGLDTRRTVVGLE
jgi:hypothetical protein